MLNQKRRQFLQLILATTGLTFTPNLPPGKSAKIIAQSQKKLEKLAIGGSPIMITILLAYLAEQSQIQNLVETVDFRIWKTHDQLRADAVSGKLQVSATPTSLAANLYQREVPIKLLNVLVWGVLNIWSAQNIRSFDDLRNKTLLIAFRGGLPSQLFFYLAKENGLNPEQDLKIQYTTDFAQAVQLLLAGRGDAALLAEPAGTGAELRGQQQGLEIKLRINLQQEWGKVTGRASRFPQAGTLALSSIIDEYPDVIFAVQNGLVEAVNWAQENPNAAAALGAKYLGLKAPVIKKSLEYTPLEMVSAKDAKEDLEFWYSRLLEQNPKLFGGNLPDNEFYFG
ncbi:MAG: hypothetical protein QNJ68_22970 [Microcoleaceae cyanobacterium MO_207.B10]|nr:hypothetical protein [Microcoleaceae cyanobacterium MO_207.B10]